MLMIGAKINDCHALYCTVCFTEPITQI